MLKVEYDELMARAAELEVPLPAAPPQNPQAPCAISFVVDSGTQLAYSATSIRLSITYAEEEYLLLAESLRNAALAYEELDQEAADAIANDSSASSVTPKSVRRPSGRSGGEAGASETPPPETPGYDGYYDLRQAIEDIEAPDQGPAYTRFEGDWNSYVLALQSDDVMRRFRPFEYWEGESAAAVEANFEQQKKYLIQLGGSYCYQVAAQAKAVVDAHKWAITEHPDSYGLYITDFWYDEYGRRGDIVRQNDVLTWYVDLQQTSEAVLAEYNTRAGLPLALVYPSKPPAGVTINPPREIPENAGEIIRGTFGGGGDGGSGVAKPGALASQLSDANLTDTLSNLQGMASGQNDTASEPFAAAAVPPTGTPGLSTGGGVKPASFGGGVPSLPLQSSADAGAATQSAAARPTGAGGAPPGMGGAMGGRGGVGGMPMGAGGANQGQGQDKKPKRYGEEEDLYTEDRPWTSSVIGSRRRVDPSEESPK
jgi:hypothetical protein